MYSDEEKKKAVELYIKYDRRVNAVNNELGYPSRSMLYYWLKEYEKYGKAKSNKKCGKKYTDEQHETAMRYYYEHGKSRIKTIRALGYPGRTIL